MNAKDPVAEVHTRDTNLKKRMRKFAEKYPELCQLTEDDGQAACGLRLTRAVSASVDGTLQRGSPQGSK